MGGSDAEDGEDVDDEDIEGSADDAAEDGLHELLTTDAIGDGDEDVEVAWALTYGMGFQLLESGKVDAGFGQRIAIRTADPRELSSLTRTTLDQRARTDRASIPRGDDLRGFGAGDFGEVVTRLVAKAEITSLTGGGKPIRLRGADALSIPLGKKPEQLVKDLDLLAEILRAEPRPELALLEQLVAVRSPELIDDLEVELGDALGVPDERRLGLSWPHERIDDNGTPTSFKIMSGGRNYAGPQDGVPELEAILAPVRGLDPALRQNTLKKMRVMLFSDAEAQTSISGAIPAIKWITYETDRDGKRYCLHDGSWYLMDQAYAERLTGQVQRIFDQDAGLALPDWPSGEHEAGYNVLAAAALGGICLDRDLIRTDLHRTGIEVCDVLLPDGTPVHVKELDASQAASHLLAQALVSTESLLYDEVARTKFQEKVRKGGWNPEDLPLKPSRVILGIARKGKVVTASDLFTFAQVTLVRHTQVLTDRGVDVLVVPITRAA
ncbi:MAG: TIGR04141 family sporadically distributed protein [Actinomycetota bacterium]|nr:TIGR04141 family sporadically distributed protein [Actinomycetota bacterium]